MCLTDGRRARLDSNQRLYFANVPTALRITRTRALLRRSEEVSAVRRTMNRLDVDRFTTGDGDPAPGQASGVLCQNSILVGNIDVAPLSFAKIATVAVQVADDPEASRRL